MVELGTVGDRCHHLLQPRCPQMGAAAHEGSGVVAWEALKASWPEPKLLSCGSRAGRGSMHGDPCGATLSGRSPRGTAFPARGSGLRPAGAAASRTSDTVTEPLVPDTWPCCGEHDGGQGSPWGWGHRGVPGARVGPTAIWLGSITGSPLSMIQGKPGMSPRGAEPAHSQGGRRQGQDPSLWCWSWSQQGTQLSPQAGFWGGSLCPGRWGPSEPTGPFPGQGPE